ncbi:hypothetical protein ACS0TY_014096 [Phlomoides rotata]
MRKFEECVKLFGSIDTIVGLRLDLHTRWNSTYLMLDSVIRYKKSFFFFTNPDMKIESLLKGNLLNENKMITDMCKKMIYTALIWNCVLDPRVKLQILEQVSSKVEPDHTKCQEKLLRVKNKLYQLFEEYVNVSKSSSSIPSSTPSHTLASNSCGWSKGTDKRLFDSNYNNHMKALIGSLFGGAKV